MKIKHALTAIAACISAVALPVANAKTVCPFVDHFMISAPLPLNILSYETDGNVNLTLVNSNYFQLSCRDVPSSMDGNAYVQVGLSDDSKCSLTIHDGPYNMNPSITYVYCGGNGGRIYFVGMEHAVGSYNYTLKFTM